MRLGKLFCQPLLQLCGCYAINLQPIQKNLADFVASYNPTT